MNKIFKVIWSKSKQCYIVVSEVAKNHSGKKKIVVASILAAMAVGSEMASFVYAGGLDGGNAASPGSIAIGSNSFAKGTAYPGVNTIDPSISLGANAVAEGNSSLAVGLNSKTRKSYAVAIGRSTEATGDYGIGIGYNVRADLHGVAIGEQARALKEGATTLGVSSRGYGQGAIAVGWQALAGADVYTAGRPGDNINNDNASTINSYGQWGDMAVGLRAMATGGNATALGRSANATAANAIAIGGGDGKASNDNVENTIASGQKAAAIGYNATASSTSATALGTKASASAENAVAIGTKANASGANATSIGTDAQASKVRSTAIGYEVRATGNNAVAIGSSDKADRKVVAAGESAIAVGTKAQANNDSSTAIGKEALAGNTNAIALGTSAEGKGDASTAIGKSAQATKAKSIAVGNEAEAAEASATAIGDGANAEKANAVAIGKGAISGGTSGIAMGNDAQAQAADTIAVGTTSRASNANDSALGNAANATGGGSTAIGYTVNASGNQSFGAGSNTAVSGSAAVGIGYKVTASGDHAISIGNNNGDNTTSATASYTVAIGSGTTAGGSGAVAIGKNVQNTKDYTTAIGLNLTASESATASVLLGYNSTTQGNQSVNIGSTNTTEKAAQYSTAIGYKAKVGGKNAIAIGSNPDTGDELIASATNSVAIGTSAQAKAEGATAMGKGAKATASNSLALGSAANSSADSAVAMGSSASASAQKTVALGLSATASSEKAVALGNSAAASANSAIALGDSAQAKANHSVAIGTSAKVLGGQGSVAIGWGTEIGENEVTLSNKVPDAQKTYAYLLDKSSEDAANDAGNGIVAIGKKRSSGDGETIARRLTGLAGGVSDYDAVNLKQVKALESNERHIKAQKGTTAYTPDANGKITLNYVNGKGEDVTGETAEITDVAKKSDEWTLRTQDGTTTAVATPQTVNGLTKKAVTLKAGDNIAIENANGTVTIKAKNVVTSITSGNSTALTVNPSNGAVTITPNIASSVGATGEDGKLVTSGKVKAALDDKIDKTAEMHIKTGEYTVGTDGKASLIQQNGNNQDQSTRVVIKDIAQKSVVDGINTTVNTHTTQISNLTTEVGGKVSQSDFDTFKGKAITFTGDDNAGVARALDTTLTVKGGANYTSTTANTNIRVEKDGSNGANGLLVKLSDKLSGMKEIAGDGKTDLVIKNGTNTVTITPGKTGDNGTVNFGNAKVVASNLEADIAYKAGTETAKNKVKLADGFNFVAGTGTVAPKNLPAGTGSTTAATDGVAIKKGIAISTAANGVVNIGLDSDTRGAIDNAANKDLSNLNTAGTNKVSELAKAAAKEAVKVAPGINTTVDTDTTTTAGTTIYKVNANDTTVAVTGDALAITGGDLGTDKVRKYSLDLSDATKGKLTAISGLATVIGGTTIAANGTVTGPTFSITKADGTSENATTLKDAIDKLNATNAGQNTKISETAGKVTTLEGKVTDLGTTVTNNYNDLSKKITDAGIAATAAATTKGLNFTGDDTTDNGKVHRDLGETLTIKGRENFTRGANENNIKVVKNDKALDVKLAENLGNIKEIAGDGTHDLVIKNGDTTVTVKAPKDGEKGSIDFGNTKLVASNLDASIKYRANDEAVGNAQSVKLADGFNYVASNDATTTADGPKSGLAITAEDNGKVTFGLDKDTRSKVDNAADKNLSNLSDAGKDKVKELAKDAAKTAVKVAPGINTTVDTDTTTTAGTTIYKVNANDTTVAVTGDALSITGGDLGTDKVRKYSLDLSDATKGKLTAVSGLATVIGGTTIAANGTVAGPTFNITKADGTSENATTLKDAIDKLNATNEGQNSKISDTAGKVTTLEGKVTDLGTTVTNNYNDLSKKITDAGTAATTKGLNFTGDDTTDNGKVHRDLGETLTIKGGENFTRGANGNNIKVVKNDKALDVKLAENLGNIKEIAGDGTHDLVIKNGDTKVTVKAPKDGEKGSIDFGNTKLVASNLDASIKYRANDEAVGNAKSVKLADGFNYVASNDATTTADGPKSGLAIKAEDNGKVTFGLDKATRTTLDNAASKEYVENALTNLNSAITGNANLNFAGNVTKDEQDKAADKIGLALATGTLHVKGDNTNIVTTAKGDTITVELAQAVKDQLAKVGDTASNGRDGKDGVSGSKGLTGADGLNNATLNDKVNALRNGEAGSVVYTNEAGDRVVKAKDGKYYKADEVKADGTVKAADENNNKEPQAVDNPQARVVNGNGDTKAPTTLSNIADGKVAANSKEAVNGGQLHNVKSDLATALGGDSKVNTDGSFTGPTYNITKDDGTNGTEPVKNVGDAISKLDTRINNANSTLSTKGLDFYGNKDTADTDKVHRNLGETLKVKGAENFKREATATNNIDVVKNTAGDGFDVKLAENLANMKEIAGDGKTDLVIKNGDSKIVVSPGKEKEGEKPAVPGSVNFGDTTLVAKNIEADITYRANNAEDTAANTVKLKKGLNFVAGTGTVAPKNLEAGTASPTATTDSVVTKKGIAISTAENGVVNIGLDSDTRGAIDNAASKDYVATELANLNSTITGNANLNFAGNVTKDAQDQDTEKVGLPLATKTLHIKGDATDITTTAKGDAVTIGLTDATKGKLAAVGNLATVIGGTTIATDGTVTGPTFNITKATGGTDPANTLKDAIEKLDAANQGQNTAITNLGTRITNLVDGGMTFIGDDATTDKVARKLGETLNIHGQNNITVKKDGTDATTLNVKLASDLKNITSITNADADGKPGSKIILGADGVSIANTATGADGAAGETKTVTIGKDGINAGGMKVTNVAKAKENGDATNKEYVDNAINNAINNSNTNVGNKGLDFYGNNDTADTDKVHRNLGETLKVKGAENFARAEGAKNNIDVVKNAAGDGFDVKLAENLGNMKGISGNGSDSLVIKNGDATITLKPATPAVTNPTTGDVTTPAKPATVDFGDSNVVAKNLDASITYRANSAEDTTANTVKLKKGLNFVAGTGTVAPKILEAGTASPTGTTDSVVTKKGIAISTDVDGVVNIGLDSDTRGAIDNAANKDLSNLTQAGKDQVSALAKTAAKEVVKVAPGINTTVDTDTTTTEGTTIYKVNAIDTTVAVGSDALTINNATPDTNKVRAYSVDLSDATKGKLAAVGNLATVIGGTMIATDGTVTGPTFNITKATGGTDTANTLKDAIEKLDAANQGQNTAITNLGTRITNLVDGGMTFIGDDATADKVARKLGEALNIHGQNNITVKKDGTDATTLNVKLASDLKSITSITNADADNKPGSKITLGADGVSIANTAAGADGAAGDTKTVTISKDGINAGGMKVTNVAKATENGDAANKEYVDNEITKLQTTVINNANLNFAGNVTKDGQDKAVDKVGLSLATGTLHVNGDNTNIVTTAKGDTITVELAQAVKDQLAKVGDTASNGRDGKDGVSGAKGLTGADGLNNATLNDKVNALRNGEAGSVVYTNEAGDRVVKAKDGKYYKADEVKADGTVKAADENNGKAPEGIENPQARVVNGNGDTKTATSLSNIADGKVAANSKEAVNGGQLHTVKSDLATALGGDSKVNTDGSFTGPTYNITKDDGTNGTEPVKNVGDAISKLDTRINNANSTLSTKGLDFYGNKDAADTDKVHRNLGETLKVKGAENFKREATATNNIDVVKNAAGDGFDVKLAENLANIKEIAGDGKTDLVIKNGDTTVTVKAPKDGNKGSIDFGDTKLVASNLDASITYRANSVPDTEAKSVKLQKGLNFVASDVATTTEDGPKSGLAITAEDDGKVTFGLDKDTRSKVDNAADKNLSNLSDAGNNKITNLAKAAAKEVVKVAPGINTTVDTDVTTTEGVTTYKVNANDTKVAITGDGLAISGGDLGTTDRVRTYTLDLSDATKGKLAAVGNLATVIGGTTIAENGTVTGPTFNITKATGGTDTANTLKDAIEKLDAANQGQNTAIMNLGTRITNLVDGGMTFIGDDATADKVNRKLGETLNIHGQNNITVKKDGTDATTLNVKLASDLKNITSITNADADGKPGSKITIGADGVTITNTQAPAAGATTGDTKTVTIGKDGINAGGMNITNVAEAKNDGDATNKQYVDNAINKLGETLTNNATLNFAGNVTKDAQDQATEKVGLSLAKGTLHVNGDNTNIVTTAKGDTITVELAKAVKDQLAKVGDTASNGRDGKDGVSGSKGLTGADGLNNATLNDKVNALRNGEAGSVVYTNEAGDRVVKAKDGKYYKADEVKADGTVKTAAENNNKEPQAVDNPQARVVNGNGDTKTATTLSNIADGKVAANSKEAVNGGQLHTVKSDLATALGGDSKVNSDGSFTGPTYNITKDDGTNGTEPVKNVGDAISKLDTRINNANSTLSTKGLDFYGNKDAADTDKVHRNLGETLKVKGAENFTRTGTNNIDVVKNTAGDGFDVKLAENLANIKEIAGDGKTDLVIKNGDASITLKPAKPAVNDPATGDETTPAKPATVDFGDSNVVAKNLDASITYRANNDTDGNAKSVKLKQGLNFVAGTGTVVPKHLEAGTVSPTATTDSVVTKKGIAISTDVDGVVNIGLDNDTRSAIDNAANQDLSNLTTAGKKAITDAAQGAVKVAAGNNVTIGTETKDNVTTYTVNGRDTTVKAATGGRVSVTGGDLNAKGEREYAVDLTDAAKAEINRISGIDTRLTTAEGNITTLQGDMTKAKADIVTNAGNIAKNAGDIATNAGNIKTNATNIAKNAGDIATNAGNIKTNATNIATNAGNIATNTKNIATNAGNIATNTKNIATNAGNIATNTSNIANNTTNISKNAQAIQALQGNSATKDLSNLTNAGKDVVTGLVNVVGTNGITVTPEADATSRVKTFTAKLDDKVTFGQGNKQITVDGTTGTITAPNATINVVNTNTVQVGDANTTNTAVTPEGVTVTTKQPDGTVTSTVMIKDGTVSGLTNTKWDPTKVTEADRGKAATQGQMKDVSDTLQKGRVFAADTGVSSTTVALGDTLAIKGEAKGALTDHNIGVELTAANGKTPATMTVRLAKNVQMKDGSTSYNYYLPEVITKPDGTKDIAKNADGTVKYQTDKEGNPISIVTTTVNGEGIRIAPVKGLNKPSVSLTADGLDNGGNAIHHVGPGTAADDAATLGQVVAAASAVSRQVNQTGAHAAALAAMNPLSYDPLKKSQVMAGYGAYKGNSALALGVAHYANEDTLFNVGVSVGNGENMVNAGMTYRFGGEDSMIPERYKGGPISSVYVMQDEITALKAESARKDVENAKQVAENEEMKAQIKMLIERVTMLEAKK
ncbi:YadA-like family protein [Veillonella sp. CHU110]|uniref:YadA-like family protein n=1 Tax=Veillonella sp. CHU110 TaxID=2490947 RepID=UPI0013E0B87E|nr:YadA-like family protein [Veillonella sp. CHU110]